MEKKELFYFLENIDRDPSRLIFEDELTGLYNRRFFLNYLKHEVQWDFPESKPTSLLMLDLDYFKEINDTYGHDVGDKVLIWVGRMARKICGDKGMVIRYGGDEFMILMPSTDKEKAIQVGEQLIQQSHKEPFFLSELGEDIHITLSIGVASVPNDATSSKSLIQKVDTALYHAKRFGRDRIASADQVDLRSVFPKTALYQLDNAKIIGRRAQLNRIAEALKKFGQRQNQFLIVEGADGMGKSEFLGAIQQSLSKNKIWQISVSATPQEMFRPYYIMTNILHEMLKQQPDKGEEILENMSPKEANYLSYILHQAKRPEYISPQEDGKTLRENIFNTIVYFILTVLDSKPLVLLIDDLHFCDKATLILIRKLLLDQNIPFFIFGTATDISLDKIQEELSPLEQFLSAFSQELSISRINLTPLTAEDIADYLRKIFPNVMLPENFEKVLAKTTQGNPLFISGILRKLVLDEKITMDGQKWVVQTLEDGYLPKSLEEIVSQKIAVIDKEGRQLLDHAAAWGENISLSVLTGSSESIESKVLEFVDQAVAQGLISTRSLMNDENIHFLSRRVLDIIYGNIQEDQKQELHERIGTYQEVLHFQHLLPSASTIAYHFQLSANRDKARIYRKSQEEYNDNIFNLQEALDYTGGKCDNTVLGNIPLDPASISQIPGVIHALLTAVRNTQLYPPGSEAVVSATERLKENIFKILIDNQRLNITQADKTLIVNGEPADVTSFKPIAEAFVKFLSRLELSGITFSRGLKVKELTVMIESFSRINMKVVDPNFWHHFSKEQRLFHIDLNQVRYTDIGQKEEGVEDQKISQENSITDSMLDFPQSFDNDGKRLDEQELGQLTQVIRCLLTSASNIKLYPPESKIIILSIENLRKALDDILIRRDSFTLTRIDEGLLVNGIKIETADFKTIAESFIDLMSRVGLNSLTFLKHISTQDLITFISALDKYVDKELNGEFWRNYSREQKTSRIIIDQHFYGILEDTIATGTGQTGHIGETVTEAKADLSLQIALEEKEKEAELEAPLDDDRVLQLTEGFLISVEKQLNDLFLKGEEKKTYQLLEQLFQNFTEQTLQIRIKIINICINLLKNLAHTSQSWVVKQLTDPLKIVLTKDKHPDLLKEISVLLTETTANLIRFGEYQCVTQFYAHLSQHLQELKESKEHQNGNLKIALIQELNEETQEILLEDLKSQDTLRQKHATRLLSIIGLAALQFLISVIKKEDDLGVRRIASQLLKNIGSEAAESIKRELVLAGFAEERIRILEIVDIITRDIKTELAYALSDENPKVRNAAFRLIERTNDEVLTPLLLDYAIHENSNIAMAAIKSLGKLKPKGSIDLLASMLNSAKDTERLITCCRSLGQLADPAGIEPLAKLMVPGSLFTSRNRKNPLVRATAAFSLGQISHPRVAEVFSLYQEDRDPRVRQSARDYLKTNRTNSRGVREKGR
jgi:diguanylate cyclase (GGDEF)-like protein